MNEIVLMVLCGANLVLLLGVLVVVVLKFRSARARMDEMAKVELQCFADASKGIVETQKKVSSITADVKKLIDDADQKVAAISKTVENAFADLQKVFLTACEEFSGRIAEMQVAASAIRIETAGAKGAFLLAASRVAAISDAAGGKLPEWIKSKTDHGKILAVENDASGERIEFEYLENGDIVSRTYRGDVLSCEVLHDANGGVKEGTAFSPTGKPVKRFVYDAMGQVSEQADLEG